MVKPEIIQQTLYMSLEELSPCLEKDEEDKENYIQTNFDEMVSDFSSEIMAQGYVILGKTLAISDGRIFAIIQYMSEPSGKVVPVEGILKDM